MPAVFLYSCVSVLLLLLLRFPAPAIKLKSPVIWNDSVSLFKFLEFLAVEFQSPLSCCFCAFFIALQNALVLQFSSSSFFLFFFESCYFVVQLSSSYKFNINLLCIYSLSLTHMMCRKREIITNANAWRTFQMSPLSLSVIHQAVKHRLGSTCPTIFLGQ